MSRFRCVGSVCILALGLVSCDALTDQPGDVTTSSAPIQGGVIETGFPAVGMVENSGALCTGTLISRTTVLTAKHCVGASMVFHTGTTWGNFVAHPVSGVVGHPSVDLAVLRLATPILNIPPLPLNLAAIPAVGSICKDVGFGIHNNPDGTISVGTKRSDTERVVVSNSMDIITHFDTGISDSGDSGSPLLCNGVIAGVASSKGDGDWPTHRETLYRTVRIGWLRPRMAPLGDVNANGASDIALVGAAGATTIPVAFSLGGGTFVTNNIAVSVFPDLASQPGVKPVAGDFNGDGRADVALVGGPGWTTIPVALSVVGSYAVTNVAVATFPGLAAMSGAKPVAGDFNGDGRSDIALVGGVGWASVPVALSTGTGAFTMANFSLATFPGLATASGAKPVAGDFNGDGVGDIALVGAGGWTTVPVAQGIGVGAFQFKQYAAGNLPSLATVAGAVPVAGDFNGDGRSDIALTGPAGWTVVHVGFAFGFPTTIFQVSSLTAGAFPGLAATAGVKLVSGDFNGDGRGDIALTGVPAWTSIPVAFSGGMAPFTVTNSATVTFPALAAAAGVKAVGAY